MSALVGVWGVLTYACSSGDENPAVNHGPVAGQDSGGGSSGSSGSSGTVMPTALCSNYGGLDGVKAMASDILVKAQADCRIAGGFAGLDTGDQQHLNECFQIFFASGFKCTDATGAQITYTGGVTKDSAGNHCRTINDAHSPNNMPGNKKLYQADYDAFLEAVTAELNAKQASKDDLTSIAAYFQGYKAGVVTAGTLQPKANAYCPGPSCMSPYPDSTIKTCSAPDGGPIDSGNDTGSDTGVTDSGDSG